ncbi:hypothetical protein CVM73_24010 [Bradyrhizobium forestalis]|uniref:Uncharacterized protein n=1 Tax=Bradyrhizobium forestalis TaxID=1419263 RepID=A0A2M8R4F4_9BRAD|nr:hypothetical protein [Bradyrhizobium forestalis]PJG52703.1 hypothetical protein CVM73_24010 [Bradyrhizobium forestalis]
MKKIMLAASLVVLLGGAAVAQTGGSKGSSTSGGAIPGTVLPAPVGHRQPRAADVPSEKNLSNPNTPANKEDAELDRKIKSICRGC